VTPNNSIVSPPKQATDPNDDGLPHPIALSEIPPASKEMTQAIESSYRRGYTQGYFQALTDLEAGHSLAAASRFLDKDLCDWRYRAALTFIVPPELGRPSASPKGGARR
jgi:hypothetical protein